MSRLALSASRVALGATLAFAMFPAFVAAQAAPFPKGGLRQIPWNANSTLTLGAIDSGDAAIALEFVHDASYGVALRSIGHRGTNADGTVALYTYDATPPAGEPTALWKAVFRPVGSDTRYELLPPAGSSFRVWSGGLPGKQTVLFEWTVAELADPLADSSFWMELRAEIRDAEPWRVEWHSRLGRRARPGNPSQYTLDEVHAPILHAKAPWFGHYERLLVPIAAGIEIPAANLPMAVWSPAVTHPANPPAISKGVAFEHPARDQQMQFSAMYGNDNGISGFPPVNFRKILYFATEDADGHYKQFLHRVFRDNNPASPVLPPIGLTYRWAPAYFPVYGPSPWLNTHASPYPAVLEALQAQTDSFWFECTQRYRKFVEREMGLTRIADPRYPHNRDFPRASPFVANSIITNLQEAELPELFPPYTAHALRLRDVFDGADGRPLPTFMEWQKWLKGDAGTESELAVPEDPIGPGYNPRPYSGAFQALKEPPQYVLDEIEAGYQAGLNVSVYTGPIAINRDDWPSFQEDWLLRQRDGSLSPVGPLSDGRIIDYGAPPVPDWMASVLYDDIFDAAPELGGVFFDVISGGGSYPRFPEDPEFLFRMRRYNGGTAYVRGTQRTFDLVRERIALGKPTTVHPDVPFIPAETVQEYLAGHYDFGQQGLKAFPNQMQLSKIYDFLAFVPVLPGIQSVNPEATNPSPPLWNAVYHEWSRAEGLTVMLSVLGVDPGLLFPGLPSGFVGMTWKEWGDYMRFVHALWWVHGSKPTSFQYYGGYQPFDLLVGTPGGGVTVRDPGVPEQQQLADFLRRLNHALDRSGEAGKFLDTGRLERPLRTPDAFDPLRVWQGASPSIRAGAAQPALSAFYRANPGFGVAAPTPFGVPGVLHFYETPFSTFDPFGLPLQNAPNVMHSVWRSVETGELGIVFVNWSDGPAWWHGTFDPRLYEGFENGTFTVYGVAPATGSTAVSEYVVGSGNGPTELAWPLIGTTGIALRHHAAPAGLMPPRSVQVFVVRPQ